MSSFIRLFNLSTLLTMGFLSVLLIANSATAQNVALLKDINQQVLPQENSMCGVPVNVANQAYFCGQGRQLYRTDGTQSGTHIISDNQGRTIRYIRSLAAADNRMYVNAQSNSSADYKLILWVIDLVNPDLAIPVLDADNNEITDVHFVTGVANDAYFFRYPEYSLKELWKTDSLTTASKIDYEFNPRFLPVQTVEANGSFYFVDDQNFFWKSTDGADVSLVKRIPGQVHFDGPVQLISINGIIYYSLKRLAQYELWSSDGTTQGTRLVKVFYEGRTPSLIRFVDVNGTLYFFISALFTGLELWKSDGTETGTIQIKTFPRHVSIRIYTFGNIVFFNTLNGTNSGDLWVSDGTLAGTFPVLNGRFHGNASNVGDLLLFSADDNSGAGTELWKTDGSVSGTKRVRDIAWQQNSSTPEYFATLGDKVIFQANKGDHLNGPEIWQSDGTHEGTVPLIDLAADMTAGSYPSLFTQVGDQVYFLVDKVRRPGPYIHQWELWKTDGTTAGTQYVENLIKEQSKYTFQSNTGYRTAEPLGGEYDEMVEFDDRLYLTGNDRSGWALWKTNGNPDSAVKLTHLLPAPAVGKIRSLLVFDNHLFFFADDGDGDALWKLAPGAQSATQVKAGLSYPTSLTEVLGQLHFSNKNNELWHSDGTEAGSEFVTLVTIGRSTKIDHIEAVNDNYFTFAATALADTDDNNPDLISLWISDGTPGGTSQLNQNRFFDRNRHLIIIDDLIYYSSTEDGLSVSNGTSSGTLSLSTDQVLYPTRIANTLYFYNETLGQLWKTDGSLTGTQAVSSDMLQITSMAQINNELYFSAYDVNGELALRKLDAAMSITKIVKAGVQLREGLDQGIENMFIASVEGSNMLRLWRTDGTTDGTVADVDLGVNLDTIGFTSNVRRTNLRFYTPQRLFALGKLFMSGINDFRSGVEPWVIDNGPSGNGRLGDWVWLDENKNGVQDVNESGLAGVTVNLEDCKKNILDTVVTDSAGQFQFSGLLPGRYQLRFITPAGYRLSPRVTAGDYRIDSNPYRNSGGDLCLPLAQGQQRLALDAGMYLY